MNRTKFSSFVLRLVCVLMIAVMSICIIGCEAKDNTEVPNTDDTSNTETTDVIKLGTGATVFNFNVTDGEENVTKYEISTDKATVGEALLELELIAGDEGDYGLYVKTVNGITADYDVDGTYWAFYIDGEMAMTGVDVTNVTAGATYEFKVEK